MGRVQRTQTAEVEDRAQVDEERIVARAREHLDPIGELDHGWRSEVLLVVGRAADADIRGRHRKVATKDVSVLALIGPTVVIAPAASYPYRFVRAGTTDDQRQLDFETCRKSSEWSIMLSERQLCMEKKGYHVDTYAGIADR